VIDGCFGNVTLELGEMFRLVAGDLPGTECHGQRGVRVYKYPAGERYGHGLLDVAGELYGAWC
jgi:hypothetical protein